MSPTPVMTAPYTIVLGNNDIVNCDAALVIEGEEVFRVREDEGRLLVDCDVWDPEDRRVAKIVRNTVIYAASGFRAHVKPGEPTEVIHEATGRVITRIEVKGPRTIKITGVFCVHGFRVFLDEAGLHTNDPWEISNTGISGFGTAISLRRGQMGIAFAERP
jgi:hypothetical protein